MGEVVYRPPDKSLMLVAWRLSGNPSNRRAFQREAWKLLSKPSETHPRQSMTPDGASLSDGVKLDP